MIILYVLETCPYCRNALEILKENKIKHKAIVVENSYEAKEYYKKQNGMSTFPQIFMQIDTDSFMKVGGSDNLIEMINQCKNLKDTSVPLDSIYYMYQYLYRK